MIYAIIVAAGNGVRMQAPKRKQFLHLARQPILTHTLQTFDRCEAVDRLIVVVPRDEAAYCREMILDPAGPTTETRLVSGGRRRQDSVYNGLKSINRQEGIVLIHDGVRPLVTEALIRSCIKGAQQWGACIPAIRPVDTPKQVDDGDVVKGTIARERLRLAQTPQAFQLPIIRKAHQEANQKKWDVTDDAALVERLGKDVHVVAGLGQNIKITTPQDLALAEFYLSNPELWS